MSKRVWVQGPIAIDTVVYVEKFPTPGTFMNSIRTVERTGGTSANVALGLCTTGVETNFVGYLGNDDNGKKLRKVLDKSEIKSSIITEIDGPTSNALVLIDDKAERTIISMTKPYLRELRMDNVPFSEGDIVAIILWREEFLNDLLRADSSGCLTVVGAAALVDANVSHAHLAIGSVSDIPSGVNPEDHLDRFDEIVLTDGLNGARYYSKKQKLQQSALKVDAIDVTGAGDAFISGYLAALANELDPSQCLLIATQWAASSVQINSSIPPAFDLVRKEWGIELPL
jgi:sugar/nucleoside kinase (ribokinase family)